MVMSCIITIYIVSGNLYVYVTGDLQSGFILNQTDVFPETTWYNTPNTTM